MNIPNLATLLSTAVPDFKGTDQHQVRLTIDGQVHDPKLLEMMEKIGQETLEGFSTQDFLIVNLVHREKPVPEPLRDRLPRLFELGIIERIARGRFILSHRYYASVGKKGTYTRKKGLDRETKKELLLKHIRENQSVGCSLEEFHQVLPGLVRSQLQVLLRELRKEEKIHSHGKTRAGRWYLGKIETDCNKHAGLA